MNSASPTPSLRRNFVKLIGVLIAVMLLLILLSTMLAQTALAADAVETAPVEMPVSINSLMVTMVDHAAHHIWDYGAMERPIRDEEWTIVEYYAIQLAAAGPAITLGGTGELDNSWVRSPLWIDHARDMSNVAQQAIVAAQDHDKALLQRVGNDLTDACEGCHRLFKQDLPTEGIDHNPDYDLLYHIFNNWRAIDTGP